MLLTQNIASSVIYLDNPEKWPVLAEKLTSAGEFGFDTETYGQPDKTSPQHRARIHCWSVGWLTQERTAYGYRRAVGVVLPRSAMDCPNIRRVLANPAIKKWAHNAPHDIHATSNEDIELNNCEDSLQWYRMAIPGLHNYGLKDIEGWALKLPPRPSFMDMIKYQVEIIEAKCIKEKGCICGAKPCHQRQDKPYALSFGVFGHHTRVSWRKFKPTKKMVERRYSVTDFIPKAVLTPLTWGESKFDRWLAWLNYSLADAVHGMESVDWLRNNKKPEIMYPWH